jgi:hypothetical protein
MPRGPRLRKCDPSWRRAGAFSLDPKIFCAASIKRKVPPQMPATTTYIVSVFEKPHWRTVLTTKDKAKALAERDRRQGAGRRDHAEGEEVLSGRIYIFQPTERLLPARCYHNDPRIGIIKGLVPCWPQFESAVSRKCPVEQRSRFWSRRQRTRRIPLRRKTDHLSDGEVS